MYRDIVSIISKRSFHLGIGGVIRPEVPLVVALIVSVSATVVAANDPISFNKDIRPILSENCFLCHGPDPESRGAGLRLDDREAAIADRDGTFAIVPGDPKASELIYRIETDDLDDRMPPPDSERHLSAEDRQKLRDWIAAGAEYERHWAFEPIAKPPVPDTVTDPRSRNPIDAFILARLQKEGLDFSPATQPEKLARRLSFDLNGLPPSLDELDGFLTDHSAGRVERFVDQLLLREAYGERMASEWLDVARYSDTYGYQVDRDRFVWPWRDWVVRAFNQNLPYDQFVTWQLAGDLLPNATRDQKLATTFNRLHPQKVEGGSVPEEFRIEYVADRTQTFATAFLGLTLECARCHDHKYDPLKQKEYYQLTSFFANINEAGLYSYFTDSIPTPTMVLGPHDREADLERRRAELVTIESGLGSIASEADVAFELWKKEQSDSSLTLADPIGHFDFETLKEGKLVNQKNSEKAATSSAANQIVEGQKGKGLKLTGDDQVDLKIGNFPRYQPFSISFWLSVPQHFDRTVVFHRSRAWTDAASRGYQLLLEDGKPSFSLIHFWPGNAIRVKALESLPLNQWVHLAIAYDGSSQADGIRIWRNGARVELEVVQDQLTKNITGGGGDHIGIGARFRDVGFKQGLVDEFRVFDQELSELEVRRYYELDRSKVGTAGTGEISGAAWREYYDLRVNQTMAGYREELRQAREAVAKLEDGLTEIMVMKEAAKPRTSYVLHRGAYDARRDAVAPETPAALPGFAESLPRNRLGLARWLTDSTNPLAARVAVNRYWQMIFGQGLVRTPEDFGSQGQLPTHPELLDWLAADFVEHGWDIKRLLRMMVTSTTYRQSSRVDASLLAADPENRLLARSPLYRLPAEMIRDNALRASGLLVERLGGPPVKPYEVAVSFKPAKVDQGDGLYRRSLYTYWKRTGPAPVMMALDASKRDVCSVKREATATPLQAFVFMNDPQFVEAARHLAQRTGQELLNESVDKKLNHMFRILTSRMAAEAELKILTQLYEDQRRFFAQSPEQTKSFLEVGQSELNESDVSPELAAMTVVASGIMSHDESIMKR